MEATEELSAEELRILLFLARNRLKYEARRGYRPAPGGGDAQFPRVMNLHAIVQKLEKMTDESV